MSLHGSFKLEFEEGFDRQVVVRMDSMIGSAGPISLDDAEADKLADMVMAMFELMRGAQLRETRSTRALQQS